MLKSTIEPGSSYCNGLVKAGALRSVNGSSATFDAQDLLTGNACLIREMSPAHFDATTKRLFQQAVMRLRELPQSPFAPLLYTFTTDDACYVVESVPEGQSLPDMGVITTDIFRALLGALRTLHTADPPLFHGALEPHHVLWTPANQICLAENSYILDWLQGSSIGAWKGDLKTAAQVAITMDATVDGDVEGIASRVTADWILRNPEDLPTAGQALAFLEAIEAASALAAGEARREAIQRFETIQSSFAHSRLANALAALESPAAAPPPPTIPVLALAEAVAAEQGPAPAPVPAAGEPVDILDPEEVEDVRPQPAPPLRAPGMADLKPAPGAWEAIVPQGEFRHPLESTRPAEARIPPRKPEPATRLVAEDSVAPAVTDAAPSVAAPPVGPSPVAVAATPAPSKRIRMSRPPEPSRRTAPLEATKFTEVPVVKVTPVKEPVPASAVSTHVRQTHPETSPAAEPAPAAEKTTPAAASQPDVQAAPPVKRAEKAASSQPEPKTDAEPKPEANLKPETKPEAKPETKAEFKPEQPVGPAAAPSFGSLGASESEAGSPPASNKMIMIAGIVVVLAGLGFGIYWMLGRNSTATAAKPTVSTPSTATAPAPGAGAQEQKPTPVIPAQPEPKAAGPTPPPAGSLPAPAVPAVPAAKPADARSGVCNALKLNGDDCTSSAWATRCVTSGWVPQQCVEERQKRVRGCMDLGGTLDECAARNR